MNDRIDPQGWMLDEWKANPVILFGHDHGIPAIARGTDIGIVDGKLKSTAEFPPEGLHPLADTVYNLAKSGFLTSASVGFMPLEFDPNKEGGLDFKKQILHEWSIVNVPALSQARLEEARGVAPAVQKWLAQHGCRPRGGAVQLPAPVLELAERPAPRWRDYPGSLGEPVLHLAETYDIDPADIPGAVAAYAAQVAARKLSALLNSLTGRMD
jgi:HK97 family phage prohead protease